MLISSTVESKYIKSDEIQDREVSLTISRVVLEDVGIAPDNETKPVLYFHDQKKGMVLNVTNRMLLKDAFGDETENWTNKKVILYTEPTRYGGKIVTGLRIRPVGKRTIQTSPPEQPAWEPTSSVITEAEAVARQGIDKFRDWKARLSDAEFKELEPQLTRILHLARETDLARG